MVDSVQMQRRGWEQRRLADMRVDRLEALTNLAFLMRIDIDRKENLEEYLRYLDIILDGMKTDESLD